MRKIWILLFCSILCLASGRKVSAEETAPQEETMDVVFVIDCSGSMKTNDPSRMGPSMVQAFIDTVQAEGIRAGYVAYNDGIVSSGELQPIGDAAKREWLKGEIGSITYSGNTDIGLGVSHAYGMLSQGEGSRKAVVLISDGETDLPMGGSRTTESSNRELAGCVRKCAEDGIQVYTVAFGEYSGNGESLRTIAEDTGAGSYEAQGPEDLIEILYGIFQDTLRYRIQQFSNGVYAGGSQNITCVLNDPYIDEIRILLLSTGNVGDTTVQYGGEEFPLANLSHYAVGKIETGKAADAGKEMTVKTTTETGQDLQVYVVSYRKVLPVFDIASKVGRNEELEYHVYFKDPDGKKIMDGDFYDSFSWELDCEGTTGTKGNAILGDAVVLDGVLKGSIRFSHSGTYRLEGKLADGYGGYLFSAQVQATNAMPSGSIPEEACTCLDQERVLCLDDYFTDPDGDTLSYSLPEGQGTWVRLDGNILTLTPQRAGTYMTAIQVSDGEETIQYVYRYEVLPLWKVYWWAAVPVVAAAAVVLWRVTHKPKPELEKLAEEKKQYHFCGKLDAYFVRQPEGEDEIPPLSVQLGRVKDSRVSIGDLFGAYPRQAEALGLKDIFLIADEKCGMILYHASESGIMLGSSIACRRIQYSISFGDVIYITSPDGCYDLEIHYIAVYS